MPGIGGPTLPRTATNLADALGKRIEHHRMLIAAFAELCATRRVHRAVSTAMKDAIRIENRNAQLVLEVLQ